MMSTGSNGERTMADANDPGEVAFRAAALADALRAAGLRGLEGITHARQHRLEREHERFGTRLGSEHPRVQGLARQLEDGTVRLRDLGIEIARAQTMVPRAGPTQWILLGYVRWPDLSPAPDLTVALVDARNQWVRKLGFACTDTSGYFSLTVSLGREAQAAASAEPLEVYIQVTDQNRAVLHREKEAVLVAPATVEYREIILQGGARVCTPPEEDTDGPAGAAAQERKPGPPSPPSGEPARKGRPRRRT